MGPGITLLNPTATVPLQLPDKFGMGSVWTSLRLQLAGLKGSLPTPKRWGLRESVGEGETALGERQRTEGEAGPQRDER